MANNRMYLRCKHCGATLYMASHMMTAWSASVDNARFNQFLNEHCYCNEKIVNDLDYYPKFKPINNVGVGRIEICYEDDEGLGVPRLD